MTDGPVSSTLGTAWRHQRVWSQTANALNRRITRWQTVLLILAITGAALVTLGAQLAAEWSAVGRTLSASGAVALAVVPVISRSQLGKNSIPEWSRARSVSEGLKSEVFLYQVRADPYTEDGRDSVLAERTQEILDAVDDLASYAAGVEPDDKALPPRMDPAAYIEQRVDAQINGYYRPRAKEIARRLGQFRALEFVLALVAATIAVIATFAPAESLATRVGAWVAVVTTAGAAVTAHIAATRYEYLASTYGATANRLQTLRDQWVDQPPQARPSHSDFVHLCEEAISVENQAWMAKWVESP